MSTKNINFDVKKSEFYKNKKSFQIDHVVSVNY